MFYSFIVVTMDNSYLVASPQNTDKQQNLMYQSAKIWKLSLKQQEKTKIIKKYDT